MMILPQVHAEINGEQSKRISLKIMSRVFNKFLKKRVDHWHSQTYPVQKYLNLLSNTETTSVTYIARLGALTSIEKLSRKCQHLILQKSFDTILTSITQIQYNQQH